MVLTLLLTLLAMQRVEWIDSLAPPPSLRQLWDRSVVVVRGVVSTCTAPTYGGLTLVSRRCSVHVIETLKAEPAAADAADIDLIQLGGTIGRGAEAITTYGDGILLAAQTEYVLFLLKPPAYAAYAIAYSDGGIYPVDPITKRAAVSKISSLRMPEFQGRAEIALDDFLALLRSYKKNPLSE